MEGCEHSYADSEFKLQDMDLGVGLNVDDDSDELNAKMGDISDGTVLGDFVEDDVEDHSIEDSFEDNDSAEPIINTERYLTTLRTRCS